MSIGAPVKTRELAREMLNDWEAIFQVLAYPHLPLTNNEAERALRLGSFYEAFVRGRELKRARGFLQFSLVSLKLVVFVSNHRGFTWRR